MIKKLTSNSRILAMVALGALLFGGLFGTSADSGTRHNSQGVYQYGGNQFIVRKIRSGNRVYLRLYRLAGDQWEEQGSTAVPAQSAAKRRRGHYRSVAERVYHNGHYRGPINVDLDNPLNTSLNRSFGGGRVN